MGGPWNYGQEERPAVRPVRHGTARGQQAVAPVLRIGLPYEGLADSAGPLGGDRRRRRGIPGSDRGAEAPVAPVPLPGVRGHLVRQRQPARDPEALGQPLLLAAVSYEGVAEEAFAFSRRHCVTPVCDAIGHQA